MPGTLDLHHEIAAVANDRCATILSGPNANDFFLAPDDRFRRLVDLVAHVHHGQGRAAVVLSNRGCTQHPVVGSGPAPLHLPPADTDPGAAMEALHRQLATSPRPVVVILDFADLVLPESGPAGQATPDQQLLLELLAAFPQDPAVAPHRIVLIARADSLDPRLSRFPGWRQVQVDMPDEAHRQLFLERLAPMWAQEGSQPFEPDADAAAIARSTGGMTCDEILREATAAASDGRPITRRWVQETKVRAIRQLGAGAIDVFPPGRGLEAIAGLPQIRLFVNQRLRSGLWPRTIILGGPPGVGKTEVVRAIADALGCPAMTLGAFHSMWHGETERNLRRAFSLQRAMAPVVVQLDEADQALGQRNNGPSANGGTSERAMAELWSFLGTCDPELRILFVLTTNRVDALDDATRSRAEIIPILHPTPTEAARLLQLELARRGQDFDLEVAAQVLGDHGPGLVSGRMLVRVADMAVNHALAEGRTAVGADDVRVGLIESLERVDPIGDERSALKAIELASFASYLPWVAASRLGQQPEMLPYVSPILGAEGLPDPVALAARIAQLDRLAADRRGTAMA